MAKQNPWMAWLAKTWKGVKAKGGTYRQAMVEAKKTYRKGATDTTAKKKVKRRIKR